MRVLINGYDQLKAAVADGVIQREQAVAIVEDWTQDRRPTISGWRATSPFFDTDPQAHWSDHGCKVFSQHRHRPRYLDEPDQRKARRIGQQGALEEAQRWASERYGITEWKRNRAGDYVPAIVQERYPIPKEER